LQGFATSHRMKSHGATSEWKLLWFSGLLCQ
jgi:hypothetical protein